jgi:acid stress-induced BolA-like protein IbaG/YrbA
MIPEEDIKQLLESNIDSCQATVEVSGSHVNLIVVSTAFEGLNPVKKQQLIYGVLDTYIKSGEIHAVNMKTFTPEQWQQQSV